MATKEELVQKLNETLGMTRPLAHWQFLQIRRWELEEMVQRAAALRERAEKYQEGGDHGGDSVLAGGPGLQLHR